MLTGYGWRLSSSLEMGHMHWLAEGEREEVEDDTHKNEGRSSLPMQGGTKGRRVWRTRPEGVGGWWEGFVAGGERKRERRQIARIGDSKRR